jgi:hypothetical protein
MLLEQACSIVYIMERLEKSEWSCEAKWLMLVFKYMVPKDIP